MSLLFSRNPLVVNPELAEKIGLNEAIILQQLHYWSQKSDIKHDGCVWVFNTIEQWHEQFKFYSYDTIKRTLKKLKDLGLVRVERLSKDKRNRTNYYAIDYEKLDALDDARCKRANCTDGAGQIAPKDEGKLHSCINGTETTTETTTPLSPPGGKSDDRKPEETQELPPPLQEWIAYRKEIRKPIKPVTIRKLLREYEADPAGFAEKVEFSIASGYQGLFAPKGGGGHKEPPIGSLNWEFEQQMRRQMQQEGPIVDTEVLDG